MANVDGARGFFPTRHLSGGEVHTREYTLTTGQTVYKGDLVKLVTAGTVEEADANDGLVVCGVAAGYVDDSASAGGKKVLVYADPNIVFGIQSDTGTATAITDIGRTANHVAGAGVAATGLSGHELDASDIGTGAQLMIIGLVDRTGNAWGAHSEVEVLINEHVARAAGTAVT